MLSYLVYILYVWLVGQSYIKKNLFLSKIIYGFDQKIMYFFIKTAAPFSLLKLLKSQKGVSYLITWHILTA